MSKPTDIIGTFEPPAGVALYDTRSGGDIGLFLFISNLIKIGTVVAGLFVLYNFFAAGFEYITAADGKGASQAREKITSSVIGLIIIIAAYTVIGLLGLLFFGNPLYFLNPEICGPNGCGGAIGAPGSGGAGLGPNP